jgi:hypothetical protein
MYNTKFVCTYHTSEVFLDTDNVTEDEKEFIRNTIYRQELLYILGMEYYNEAEINTAMNKIYNKAKENDELKKCMNKLAGQFMKADEVFGLMLLFSYDYMYLTHICISELFETGIITDDNIEKLKKAIKIHLN